MAVNDRLATTIDVAATALVGRNPITEPTGLVVAVAAARDDDTPTTVRFDSGGVTLSFERHDGPLLDDGINGQVRVELYVPTGPGAERVGEPEDQRLRHLADFDDLTQALNRRAFLEQGEAMLSGVGGAMVLLDLDHFKRFNDSFGHEAGDLALIHVIKVIRSCIRDQDPIGRLGGEEFAVAMSGVQWPAALQIAERMRTSIEDLPVAVNGMELPCTVSIGVYQVEADASTDVATWVREADRLLYEAKHRGRNQVVGSGDMSVVDLPASPASKFESIVSPGGPFRVGELQAAWQLLALVMDHIPQAVFWKDLDSVYLGCNVYFAKQAGLDSPQDIVGLTDFDLPWAETDAAGFVEWDQRVMSAGQPELGILERLLTASGEAIWLSTNKVPLRSAGGQLVGILGTFLDVTDLHQRFGANE